MEKTSGFKKFTKSKSFTLLIVLILIIVIFSLLNKNYFKGDTMRNIMYSSSLSGTLAVGIGCILISGNADLSVGSIGCFGALLTAFLLQSMPWVPALIIGIIFGACAGLINALLANEFNIMPFIGTMAMGSVWKGFCYYITNNVNVPISNTTFWKVGGLVAGIPVPFIIMCALYLIYGLILSSTSFGRKIYMVGGNRQAARLAGINLKKMNYILFANSGAIAALGGSLVAARMHTGAPAAIHNDYLDGITSAVLGGIAFGGGSGGMLGGFIGLLVLNTFSQGLLIVGMGPYWQVVANGLLLIAALVVDFFNERAAARRLKVKVA